LAAAARAAAEACVAEQGGEIAPGVVGEDLADGWGVHVRSSRAYERFRSPFQAVEVYESAAFGKLLRLDGRFVASEKDEFHTHENLVHVAGIAHPAPERALVIGGGDGGAAEELLKYRSIASVALVELDLAVVDVARKYFTSVHRGSLDDPRVDLRIGDGLAFLRESTDRYDLVVLDLTEPGGPSLDLHAAEFYRACAARLQPSGAMALHVASPVAQPARVREILTSLRAAFPVVAPYLATIPLRGGPWMMACCSTGLDPRKLSAVEVDRRVAQRGLIGLQSYNGDMHRAAFALPNFVRALVG
jgi:spermidine synthase